MGSLNVESNNLTNEIFQNKTTRSCMSDRSDVFPCLECGRYFTLLAMPIHKRTCLENENCKCYACRSDLSRKNCRRFFKNNKDSFRNNPSKCKYKKKKSFEKSYCDKQLAGEMVIYDNEKLNNVLAKSDKEKQSIVDNILWTSENSEYDVSMEGEIERAVFNDHEYISTRMESSENSDNSRENLHDTGKLSPIIKSKQKINDHDCDRKLFCRYCDTHVFWESFGIHIIQHCKKNEETGIHCPECERSFSQPALFLTHYLVHNSEHSVFCNCKSCSCNFPSCIYMQRATDENFAENHPHHCYICLQYFSHPQTVINHMRLHSKEMPFQCQECSRTFRQIGNLQRHIATHRGDRPYSCPNCSSSFADPATLRNHERVHTGETPYVCDYCSRGFSQIGNLKRHMALHLQKDPSSKPPRTIEVTSEERTVSIVNPPNGIKINTNIHNENVQSILSEPLPSDQVNNTDASCDTKIPKNGKMKVVTCKICSKIYAWQHDLDVHYRTHTGEKPYKCELCGKQFAQSGAINTHKMRHHAGVSNAKRKCPS